MKSWCPPPRRRACSSSAFCWSTTSRRFAPGAPRRHRRRRSTRSRRAPGRSSARSASRWSSISTSPAAPRTLPIALKDYADRVQEMLRQYVRAARGKIILNQHRSEAGHARGGKGDGGRHLASRSGRVTNQPFYFGLVAIQADQQKTIPALTTDREQFLEYDLSQLLYQVQQVNRPKLGLLTSLPLQGPDGFHGDAKRPAAVQPAGATTSGRRPTTSSTLSRPRRPSPPASIFSRSSTRRASRRALEYAIDQFLLSGKPVFIAVDPSSRTQPHARQPGLDDGRARARRHQRPARPLPRMGHRLQSAGRGRRSRECAVSAGRARRHRSRARVHGVHPRGPQRNRAADEQPGVASGSSRPAASP